MNNDYLDYLAHARTPGSKNGVSHTPGYTAVGKPAMSEAERKAAYSSKQRTQDRKLYGRRAEKRIAKRIGQGEGVLSARHDEVVRKERNTVVKKKIKKAAKIGGIVIGSAALIDLAARGKESVIGKGTIKAFDTMHNIKMKSGRSVDFGKYMSNKESLKNGLDFFANGGKEIVSKVLGHI